MNLLSILIFFASKLALPSNDLKVEIRVEVVHVLLDSASELSIKKEQIFFVTGKDSVLDCEIYLIDSTRMIVVWANSYLNRDVYLIGLGEVSTRHDGTLCTRISEKGKHYWFCIHKENNNKTISDDKIMIKESDLLNQTVVSGNRFISIRSE